VEEKHHRKRGEARRPQHCARAGHGTSKRSMNSGRHTLEAWDRLYSKPCRLLLRDESRLRSDSRMNQDAMCARASRPSGARSDSKQLVIIWLAQPCWWTPGFDFLDHPYAAPLAWWARRFGLWPGICTASPTASRDEVAQLARVSTHGRHLERYRASSLGELLQTQQAARRPWTACPIRCDAGCRGPRAGHQLGSSRLLAWMPIFGPRSAGSLDRGALAARACSCPRVGGRAPTSQGFEEALPVGDHIFLRAPRPSMATLARYRCAIVLQT